MACEKCGCSIRVRYCGEEWIVASDGNDDGVLELGFQPRIVPYTGNEPDASDATVGPDPADGSILPSGVFATNSDGEITHVGFCGQWLRVAGGASVPAGDTERVCYPVSAWNFPATFGGGCDLWLVDGDDVAQDDCTATDVSYCPDSSLQSPYGTGTQNSPANGWDSLSWDAGAASTVGCAGTISHVTDGNRTANRWMFGTIPAGTTAFGNFVQYSFDYLDGDGTILAGVYDPVSDSMLSIAAWNAPVGAIVSVERGGTELRSLPNQPNLIQGNYTIAVDVTGYVLEDLELVLWQVGDGNSNEVFGNPAVSFQANVDDGCFAWQSAAGLAGWMNMNTTNGIQAVWFVDGSGNICANVPIGTGSLFGEVASCDGQSAIPTVV